MIAPTHTKRQLKRFARLGAWRSGPFQLRPCDRAIIGRIRRRTEAIASKTDDHLRGLTEDLRQHTRGGIPASSISIVVEAFSLLTEAVRRTHSKVYYDVQLLGGLAMATGAIAEMQTGEGKTITTGLAAFLYALGGRGVHVATTNSYLTARDCEEMSAPFSLLGMSVGLINSELPPQEKRAAYACDVTYGTGYDFGFDFLRDQLSLRNEPRLPLGANYLRRLRGVKTSERQLIQREHAFAIIDECDSVLIDEATTPLILSGPSRTCAGSPEAYHRAREVADTLKEDRDFIVDDSASRIDFTEGGWEQLHELQLDSGLTLNRPWSAYVEQSLRAKFLIEVNVDFVVRDGKIVLVDQNTGRLHDDRTWRGGLHQAVELRADVPVTPESETQARISRQRYYRFYDRVAGLTGTATGNETEFMEFYRLPVVVIPRNQPSRRRDIPGRFFRDEDSKFTAIAADISKRRPNGQPILMGTRTIRQTIRLSRKLEAANVPHTVLNGIQDEAEANIIAQAGVSGSVTIATNMAGRGTDIRLDARSRECGGLHVIGVEHHDSPRVDRQLQGRAGRQSDPGSSQFFTSADDEIISLRAPELAETMRESGDESGECRENHDARILEIQRRCEEQSLQKRRGLLAQDDWLESVLESVASTS